jgi:hypothetical protein
MIRYIPSTFEESVELLQAPHPCPSATATTGGVKATFEPQPPNGARRFEAAVSRRLSGRQESLVHHLLPLAPMPNPFAQSASAHGPQSIGARSRCTVSYTWNFRERCQRNSRRGTIGRSAQPSHEKGWVMVDFVVTRVREVRSTAVRAFRNQSPFPSSMTNANAPPHAGVASAS